MNFISCGGCGVVIDPDKRVQISHKNLDGGRVITIKCPVCQALVCVDCVEEDK